jgi:hypothetical protein
VKKPQVEVEVVELARDTLREMLLALAAKGAPSLSEISRRLGHDRGHLSRWLGGRGGAFALETAVVALKAAGGRPADWFAEVAHRLQAEEGDVSVREQMAVDAFLRSISSGELDKMIDRHLDAKLEPIRNRLRRGST